MNIFDERGIITHGIDEVRQEMVDEATVKFADVLEGKPLRADDSSILGRTFSIVAKPIVENSDILPQILASLDPNSVQGQAMDNLFEVLYRLKRKDSDQANGLLLLRGTIGTLVSAGSEVSNTITGDYYQTDSEVRFSTIEANAVDVEITEIGGTYTLDYDIDNLLSKAPVISFIASNTDTTKRAVADRFVDAVKSQSSYLDAVRNNDNTVTVSIKDKMYAGSFSVSENMSVVSSWMPVYATAVTYNSKESMANQVTSIRSAKSGWLSVTNPFYIPPSTGVEDDEDYRYRAKLKNSANVGSDYDSIILALKSVKGVTYQNVQANKTNTTSLQGITNHGLSVTVMGGNENDIALALYQSVGAGIDTVGDIVKEVKDVNGTPHEIRFSRPRTKDIEISLSLEIHPNFPSNGISLIRQAIVEWFNNLEVGETIYYSRLYNPINSVQGFAVRGLMIGEVGGTLSANDVHLSYNELATISAENIKVGGR